MRMTKRNLRNIQKIFRDKTGVDLEAKPLATGRPVRKMAVLVAVLIVCLAMAAFTYPLFSSLDGDELSLEAVYEGEGIVSIYVQNRSDKTLKFQEETKLIRWITAEEVQRLDGEVTFENTEIPPHSEGIMKVDLSGAYDTQALEQNANDVEWFYLVLTNNQFLFGQEWICSVNFSGEKKETVPEETLSPAPVEPVIAAQIEEELRFYFEDTYADMPLAFNEQNYIYMQKVQELLARFEGNVVKPADPMLIVNKTPEGVVFDESVPMEQQYALVGQQWHAMDGYNRLVGTGLSDTGSDRSLQLMVLIPSEKGETDGGVYLPLIHLFTYNIADVQGKNNFAFIYGQLHSFDALEKYRVYQDEQYAVYEVTDLFYTDLDAYIDDFLQTGQKLYCDEQIRQRIHNIYDYYKNSDTLRNSFHYHLPGLCPDIPAE